MLSNSHIPAWPHVLVHHITAQQRAFRNQNAAKWILVHPTGSSLHHSQTLSSHSIPPYTMKTPVHTSAPIQRGLPLCPALVSLRTKTRCGAEDRQRIRLRLVPSCCSAMSHSWPGARPPGHACLVATLLVLLAYVRAQKHW